MEYPTLQNATERLGLDYESTKQFLAFGLIGGLGTLLNTAILFLLHTLGGMHYLLAAAIATEAAIISNFIGNHAFTFKREENDKSLLHKFLLFQAVSLFTLVGTLIILWTLTTLFGVELVLVWNLIAILVMFLANFALNKRYTWGGAKVARKVVGVLAVATLALLLFQPALAAPVSVSQLGYHPDSAKRVVVYGESAPDGFAVMRGSSAVYEGDLEAARCQGGQQCLIGDFSDLTTGGSYQVSTPYGASPHFSISTSAYSGLLDTLGPYYNAQRQRGSDYHPDLHGFLGSYFTDTADGSFLMEADQASVTLARLGSAYRRNPDALSTEHIAAIERYTQYLMTLQGTGVEEGEGDVRLDPQFHVDNAFVVGPTSLTSYEVHDEEGRSVATVDVVSICTDGNTTDQGCAERAASFYGCEAGEVCLNQTYGGRSGALVQTNSLAVPKGWAYEFGCYFDVGDVDFSDGPNPCMIFQEETDPAYTARMMLAILEAYPALVDNGGGQAALTRAQATAEYLSSSRSADAGAYGASMFLLYDYTGEGAYLEEAHAMRSSVSTSLRTGLTHMNEFYWEEYVRHKDAIEDAGLGYAVGGQNPEELFTGKLIYDEENAIAGDGVYELGSTSFSHSRPILIEGVIAAKTAEMGVTSQYPFISRIADDQVSWLAGQNAVQSGLEDGSLTSYSFIFGVGDNPNVFHSRLYMTTGYADASGGSVIGARETDFASPDGELLDGRFGILGYELGTVGAQVYDTTQSLGGHAFIPGWINGAHDTNGDGVWNYEDDFHSFTFTETTNEMVAAATELAAYQDARKNGAAPHPLVAIPTFDERPVANASAFGLINVTTTPSGAMISLDGQTLGTAPRLINTTVGSHAVRASLAGYALNSTTVNVRSGATVQVALSLAAASTANGTLRVTSTPLANVTIDGAAAGTTPLTRSLAPGSYLVTVSRSGYFSEQREAIVTSARTTTIDFPLEARSVGAAIIDSDSSVGDSMQETQAASFSVALNSTGAVTWMVDGEEVRSDTGVRNSSLSWTPGVLYSGGSRTATVVAKTGADRATWTVAVDDVINPYFSGPEDSPDTVGADTTILHVFTDDEAYAFDELSVTLLHDDGTTTAVALAPAWQGGGETDWRASLGPDRLAYGENYIHVITGTRADGSTQSWTLPSERTHYRQEPSRASSGGSGGGSGGGGGLSLPPPFRPSLVYLVFEDDVVGVNDTQGVTLDMRSFENEVAAVMVVVEGVDGDNLTAELELVDGDGSYGTWSGELSGFTPGQHEVRAVIAGNYFGRTHTFDEVEGSFYVIDSTVAGGEHLGLVYATLDKTQVENGTPVVIRLDARDADGITNVSALITSDRGDRFIVPLERVSGDANYGTYEGAFEVRQPGSTYELSGVRLSNHNQTVTREVEGRSVYVRPLPGVSPTGLAAAQGPLGFSSFEEALDHPLAPAAIGLSILVLAVVAVFAKDAVTGLFRRDG